MKAIWIKARAFCYPTEDEGKVLSAVRTIFPGAKAKKSTIDGEYGQFYAFEYETKRAKDIDAFIPKARELKLEIGKSVDEEGCLYARFDKQKACLGVLQEGTQDVVWAKMKVVTYPFDRDKIIAELKEAFS